MAKNTDLGTFTKKRAAPTVEEKPDRAFIQKKFMLTPAQNKRIKEFCAQQEMTQQEFMLGAVGLMFKSRGLPGL